MSYLEAWQPIQTACSEMKGAAVGHGGGCDESQRQEWDRDNLVQQPTKSSTKYSAFYHRNVIKGDLTIFISNYALPNIKIQIK